jgi:apolipoprotein N-acyltransferase
MIVQVGTFARGELLPPLTITIDRDVTKPAEHVRIGPSICFEDLFPYIHRYYARDGAQLFVNTTNDAWFDGSTGPAWHMDMARWRSIETHIPMMRVTNSGVTVHIDYAGRVVESLPTMEKGVLQSHVNVLRTPPRTIYARTGDWAGLLSFIGAIAMFVCLKRRERR